MSVRAVEYRDRLYCRILLAMKRNLNRVVLKAMIQICVRVCKVCECQRDGPRRRSMDDVYVKGMGRDPQRT